MKDRALRRFIFGEMINVNGKKAKSVKLVWKIVFLVEEYGYEYLQARRRLKFNSKRFSRHTYRLYQLRKTYITRIKEMENGDTADSSVREGEGLHRPAKGPKKHTQNRRRSFSKLWPRGGKKLSECKLRKPKPSS